MDQDYLNLIETFKEYTQNTMIAWFSANLGMSIFASFMLTFLWSMINSLQIIMLTSLFNLEFPILASQIMATLMKLLALDFIDTDSAFEEIFGFEET